MCDKPPPSTSLSRLPEPGGQGPAVEVAGSCSCLPSPASPVTGQVESGLGLTHSPIDRLTGVPGNHLSLSGGHPGSAFTAPIRGAGAPADGTEESLGATQ